MDKVSYNAGWDAFKNGVSRDDYGSHDKFSFQWGWDASLEASLYVKGLFS